LRPKMVGYGYVLLLKGWLYYAVLMSIGYLCSSYPLVDQ
jgi:hypothetical protein